jgi:hypothetical protein
MLATSGADNQVTIRLYGVTLYDTDCCSASSVLPCTYVTGCWVLAGLGCRTGGGGQPGGTGGGGVRPRHSL